MVDLYLIMSGRVEISGQTALGDYQTISILEAGNFLGEFAAIDRGPRSARAEIREDGQLAVIPGEFFYQILLESPTETSLKLIENMIQRIRKFHERFFTEVVQSQRMVLVGELTSSIIHDIRSPLSVITGTSSILKRKRPEADVAEACDLINMQCQRIQSMAGEVLDFSKGTTTVTPQTVDLQPYFKHLNQEYYRQHDVHLSVIPAEITLTADPDKIVRIMQNLCNNAVQAMENGGNISIEASLDDDVVTISISDDGPGIPDEIVETLFDPFVSSGTHKGTGLGMAITQSLVGSHGGVINFETSDQGTTFYIKLPTNPGKTLT